MENPTKWQGATKTHDFFVEVFSDAEAGLFVAKIDTRAPASMPESKRIPGKLPTRIQYGQLKELRYEDREELLKLTKQLITDHCGEILWFHERLKR